MKNIKVKTMTYQEVNQLMDNSKRNIKDVDSFQLLENLITSDVCIWWLDNNCRGRFRAVTITSVSILDRSDGAGELCINFDVLTQKKNDRGVNRVPHFGFWTLRRNGGFIQPWIEFGENDEELIIPGTLEIKNK